MQDGKWGPVKGQWQCFAAGKVTVGLINPSPHLCPSPFTTDLPYVLLQNLGPVQFQSQNNNDDNSVNVLPGNRLECSLLGAMGNAFQQFKELVLGLGLALEQAGWRTSPYFAISAHLHSSQGIKTETTRVKIVIPCCQRQRRRNNTFARLSAIVKKIASIDTKA